MSSRHKRLCYFLKISSGDKGLEKKAIMGPTPQKIKQYQSGPGISSDLAHAILDIVGIVPVVGEFADLANAALYLSKGASFNNLLMAALSVASMVPGIGDLSKVIKYGSKITPDLAKRTADLILANRGAIEKAFSSLNSTKAAPILAKLPNGNLLKNNATKLWPALDGWAKGMSNYAVKGQMSPEVKRISDELSAAA